MEGLIALDASGVIVGARLSPRQAGIVGKPLREVWAFSADDTALLLGIAARVDGFAVEATLRTSDRFAVRRRCVFRRSGLHDAPLTLELEALDGGAYALPLPVASPSGVAAEPDDSPRKGLPDSMGTTPTTTRSHGPEPRSECGSPTIGEALALYLGTLETDGHHTTELSCKRGNVEWFAREAGWVYVADMTTPTVTRAKTALASRSSGTIRKYLIRLSGFAEFCVSQSWLEVNPVKLVRKPKHVRGEGMRALTPSEVEALTLSLLNRPGRNPDDTRAHRARSAYYTFAALTGLRYSECRRLRWAHVDRGASPPVLRLPASLTKSRKAATLPLVAKAVEALELVRMACNAAPSPTDPVFPSLPSPRTFDADLVAAGIPKVDEFGRSAGIHSLRKHLATALADGGADLYTAQAMMRHADIKTTRDSYIDDRALALPAKACEALERADARRATGTVRGISRGSA